MKGNGEERGCVLGGKGEAVTGSSNREQEAVPSTAHLNSQLAVVGGVGEAAAPVPGLKKDYIGSEAAVVEHAGSRRRVAEKAARQSNNENGATFFLRLLVARRPAFPLRRPRRPLTCLLLLLA